MDERFRVGVHCSRGIGPHRGGRSKNEDNFLVATRGRARFMEGGIEREVRTEGGAGLMLVVADGMGGHDHGAMASGAAVQAMLRLFQRGRPRDTGATLTRFVRAAHTRLRDRAASAGATNMGTTLTVLWIIDNDAWWVHVGDSRLYHLRQGGLSQLSRDHIRAEFARRDGRPQPPRPRALSQNFMYGSRGLGDDDGIRIDEGVDTGHVRLQAHDRFLICSDGISGCLSHDRLADMLLPRGEVPPSEAAQVLARAAMESGSDDNVTALVLQVERLLALDDHAGWRLFEEPPTEPRLHRRRDRKG